MKKVKSQLVVKLLAALSFGGVAASQAMAAGTTFNLVNGTNGAYPDSKVYWTLVGMDPAHNNAYVHVNCAGNLIPMSSNDNSAQTKNGIGYANYSIPFSQCKSVTVAAITSARLYLTVGSTLYLQAVGNPATGYTGPNIENPTDPNIDVVFDFVEFDSNGANFFGNTTRVDQFGFPLRLRLQGQGGFDQTVGETESRAALFQAYQNQVPAPFQGLSQAPYRIVAPAHGSFKAGGANANYLDSYIQSIWNLYSTQTLTFTDAQGTFSGRVVNGQFQFTDGQGTYYINHKPTTSEVLLGNGVFNDASNAAPGVPTAKQLQIQAQVSAAINRHVAENAALWTNPNAFYASQPTNSYAQFWHAHAINKLSYGFSYDDVGGFSSSLVGTNPTVATVTVGW
ncbi:glycoside hydrolase family 64 protein [Burkholderia gladioli]|uniref:glycoside hydrolase family 64 protein n=1 Tax=Burkholderia gladioli TaxID=28095 RepID=UPI00163F9DC8|nr:glycoside hydrolase family 64 protein [Burkholderia gladioli]